MLKLPSKYIPYSFKEEDLALKEMTGKELGLMSKAVIADDISYAIEAMDSIVSVDISNITVPDFYFLMLKARYDSMPDSKPGAHWLCEGEMYKDANSGVEYNLMQLQSFIKAYEKDPENNKNPDDIKVTTVTCGNENFADVAFEEFPILYLSDDVKLDDDMDFPRCKNLPSLLEAMADPENCLMAQAAQWLKEGDTILDKLDILKAAPVGLYDRLAKFNQEHNYGVVQVVTKACPKCGKEQRHSFNIVPDIFFRL